MNTTFLLLLTGLQQACWMSQWVVGTFANFHLVWLLSATPIASVLGIDKFVSFFGTFNVVMQSAFKIRLSRRMMKKRLILFLWVIGTFSHGTRQKFFRHFLLAISIKTARLFSRRLHLADSIFKEQIH